MKHKLCGCCEGSEIITPMSTANRPGLNALIYRVGTHAAFLETMIARLSSHCLGSDEECRDGKGLYPLQNLTTRDDGDPAIALLDAWSIVADVLTFYQERIANEGYLRTATERRSILELARLVGYKLRPGVSASVYLAFTMEKEYKEEIPAGTRAQSIPGPDELPQSFETSEPLDARAEWNEIKPRLTRPQYITKVSANNLETIYFQGISTNLKPNDRILFVFGIKEEKQIFRSRIVHTVETQDAEDRTKVTLQKISTTKTLDAFIESVNKTLERYLDLDSFGVSPKSKTAKRVIEISDKLKKSLKSQQATKIVDTLREIIPDLDKEHTECIEGKFTKLAPWIGGMCNELTKAVESMPITFDHEDIVDRTGMEALSNSNTGTLSVFGQLLEPLLKDPSIQPANSLRLPRTIEETYKAKSDVAPQLLVNFKPELKENLYNAWANAVATKPSSQLSLETFRVKAKPFGHNAPLKPIFDEKGLVIGHEEWPLSDVGAIKYSVKMDDLGVSARPSDKTLVTILFILGTDSWGYTDRFFNLRGKTIELGNLKFKATYDNDDSDPSVVKFQFNEKKSIIFRNYKNDEKMSVQVDNDKEHTIIESQKVHYSEENRKVQIEFGQNGTSLTISDESFASVPMDERKIMALDNEYDQISPGSWVLIERPDQTNKSLTETLILQVEDVKTVSKAAYGISGKSTQLTLNGNWLYDKDLDLSVIRDTNVYAQSAVLYLAEEPIDDEVAKDEIELDGLYDGLVSGRWLIVSGERTDIPGTSGVMSSELVMLAGITQDVGKVEVQKIEGINQIKDLFANDINKTIKALPGDKTHTTINIANELAYKYKRNTVKIYGNVVKATHGETRKEVLGSGDGSKAFQQFTLKQLPLTYLAAAIPSGAETTLEVRVNEVLWHEADNLVGLKTNDRGYITQTDNENKTTAIFGNGRYGARLPTGPENVKAVYRNGIGKPGNVDAEQISQLVTKPLGVKAVINPLKASGGADRENRDQARRNTPMAVMALDRLVSVKDYADFARTFAGIGKSSSVRLSDGRRELVHITIAGSDDIPIEKSSDLYRNLCQALHNHGDPHQPIKVEVRDLMLLIISAKIRLHSDFQWESVEPQIRTTLLNTFSFERQDLGQDVLLSQVINTIQAVKGVVYVNVDVLDSVDEGTTYELEQLADVLILEERILVEMGRIETPRIIRPAQIAYLSPDVADTLILEEIA